MVDKTTERVMQFQERFPTNINQLLFLNGELTTSIISIVDVLTQNSMLFANSNGTIMHGDFCFSNIMYDFRSCQIKLIDPRGSEIDHIDGLMGPLEYDIGKFLHSAVYGYDKIIAGMYSSSITGDQIITDYQIDEEAELILHRLCEEYEIDPITIKLLVMSLFLSMIPLHHDRKDRQLTFLCVVLRIYQSIRS